MARTVDELDRQLARLQDEVESLRRQKAALEHPIRKLAGSLHEDEELTRILDDLEAQRSLPDPELQETR